MIQNRIKISKKQKAVAASAVTAVAVTYVTLKYRSAIKSAYNQGMEDSVNQWLREMADNGCSMLVLPKELAEKMFTQANLVATDVAA
jgi:hypothetical protein